MLERSGRIGMIMLLLAAGFGSTLVSPDELLADDDPATAAAKREQSRATAVALNYCRASFHRIRRDPSKQVLVEEQEKILNNLNLNGIADEEVVKLYSGVLDEIGQIEIAERERQVLRQKHNDMFASRISANVFVGAAQIMSAQFSEAVRTGVDSWWDYRTMEVQRDFDTWKVEKARMTAIVDKSSDFMDAFWKLSRSRDIPDNWLVRDDDLDRLQVAAREPDLETRLRVLKRMERFMECYPPYWYYAGRTQQQLGMLREAEDTYEHLASLGEGHFRKDDMLAAGLANLAALQEASGNPAAPRTAARALEHSTAVWQANLMCAGILQRHGQIATAEDAVLRNLDVELEQSQSRVALTMLYAKSNNLAKLRKWVSDPQVARHLPGPILLQTAGLLGSECPLHVRQALHLSFYGYTDVKYGTDDVVLMVSREWQPQGARVSLVLDGTRTIPGRVRPLGGGYEIRFPGVAELGTPWNRDQEVRAAQIVWKYRDATSMELKMAWVPAANNYDRGLLTAFNDAGFRSGAGRDALRITHFRVDQQVATAPTQDVDHSGQDPVATQVSTPSNAAESTNSSVGTEPVPAEAAGADGERSVPNGAASPQSDPVPARSAPVTLLPLEPLE